MLSASVFFNPDVDRERFCPRISLEIDGRRARGEEHEKCDQTAKKLANRSVCEGASEAGCMYSRTAENPHLSLVRSNVRRIT